MFKKIALSLFLSSCSLPLSCEKSTFVYSKSVEIGTRSIKLMVLNDSEINDADEEELEITGPESAVISSVEYEYFEDQGYRAVSCCNIR